MKTNDGGPAFPISPMERSNGTIEWGNDGMSLRDYFAAKAMQGLVIQWGEVSCEGYDSKIEIIPKRAYEMADAMLKAREDVKE